MADFQNARDELTEIRRELAQKRHETLLAQEAVGRAERHLAGLQRRGQRATADEADRVRRQLKEAQQWHAHLSGEVRALTAVEGGALDTFAPFTDPRSDLGRLSAGSPILLLPVRLETRFKRGSGGPELWVRIYPDTCLIDTFEASLSEAEVANAQAFWVRMWCAGGDEAAERTAWRELAGAHGSGRAGWIIRQYLPLNLGERPLASDVAHVRLIISAEGPLPPAAHAYWEAAWRAGGNAAAAEAAAAALEAALGSERAREIAERYRPFNFADEPPAGIPRATAIVRVLVAQFPSVAGVQMRRASWSSPARVDLLPDRFVLIAYPQTGEPITAAGGIIRTPLLASPDPKASPDRALKQIDDDLQIPAELAWMFDFDAAEKAGMAMRVKLTPAQAATGFRRVIVVGVRLADSPDESSDRLASLLEHHLHSRTGLQIVPQGTPTNNTERDVSGFSFHDDPDASFAALVREVAPYTPDSDPLFKRDGQWLEDLLTLPHDLVRRIPHADGTDQSDARAMQIALWPATLGYTMNTLLEPVFADRDVAWTRGFFTRYVTGRGPLPTLRIGDQPYGILPVTAFASFNPVERDRTQPNLRKLCDILRRVEDDWKPLVDQLSFIGKPGGDPHQRLLDVLGLHPSSVEYYPLHSESVEQKFFELSFFNFSVALNFLGLFPAVLPMTLLRSFGYVGAEVPDLLTKIFKARQTPLTGPLVDDRPLSETERIRPYAATANYIEWLAAAARQGIEALQQERGFDGDTKPAALLYLLLRHAVQLAFHTTAVALEAEAGLIADVKPFRREPAFVHVAAAAKQSDSRYDLLFREAPQITGAGKLRLGDYIARTQTFTDPTLSEQISALERLALLPTAKLERLLAEHLDCCAYRLDAWKTGVMTLHLERLRGDGKTRRDGFHLGAFGWLEPLLPKAGELSPAEVREDVRALVNRHDKGSLMRDPANGGLVHAPSINHATTAAVLRNGYLANDGRLAVNLTSRRVRLALGILQGIRNGQSLGALLGYQFERFVHDNGPLLVRDLIYHLRRAFPLAANQIAGTNTESGEAQESIAAMNVVDGRRLIEQAEKGTAPQTIYPFGTPDLPRRAADQEQAITDALAHIRDINDALADLALAEGIHQAVLGNYDRSAGMLEAFAKGTLPPEPDVMRTPRTGIGLTLRTAIHLSPAPPADPLPGIPLTPLAAAEPAVNAWLRDRLPLPPLVGCPVTFTDRATNVEQSVFVSQETLALHPLDLLYRVQAAGEQALGDIDDQILRHVQTVHAPRHDRPIVIHHTVRVTERFTWFELQALLRSLRAVLGCRPLKPADLMRANDASTDQQAAVFLPRARVADARNAIDTALRPALQALAADLNDATVSIDTALGRFANTVGRFAAYRLPQTGTGFVFEWRAATYSAIVEKLQQRVGTWDDRLRRYDQRIDEYDNLPAATPAEERIAKLSAAELIVSRALTSPLPTDPDDYRDNVLVGRRAALAAKRDALGALVDDGRPTLAALVADAKNELPLTAFDVDDLDLSPDEHEIARFRAQLLTAAQALAEDVTTRLGRVDAILVDHDAAADSSQRAALLQKGAQILFGDDFQLIPSITLPAAAAEEFASAWAYSQSGELTEHLRTVSARDFPVDDWLHGVARVREKMRHWENVALLGDAVAAAQPPDLTPLQLPVQAGDPWLALEFPSGHEITSDRLLYTAHFAEPVNPAAAICGVLVDEWTEVVPGTSETTGIAFHYDRPNSEPPQTWLLALPASLTGEWSWDQLLGAVNDAFDSAKRRAVEPMHIDRSAYSWFLPATTSAYTFPETSISNNLLRNRAIYELERRPG